MNPIYCERRVHRVTRDKIMEREEVGNLEASNHRSLPSWSYFDVGCLQKKYWMGKRKGKQRKKSQTEDGLWCQTGPRNQDEVEKRPLDQASGRSVLIISTWKLHFQTITTLFMQLMLRNTFYFTIWYTRHFITIKCFMN